MRKKREDGSLLWAVEHLLASLDDFAALRQNPLVAHRFDGWPEANYVVAQVHADVIALIHKIADRQSLRSRERALRRREILLRYDIEGRPRKEVADALGIAARHFYRERRVAFLQLGHALLSIVPPTRTAAQAVSIREFTTAFSAGFQLSGIGNDRIAIDHFDRLSQQVHDPEEKLFVLLAAAQLHFDNQDPNAAAMYIANCEALIHRNEHLPAACSDDLTALLALARARSIWWGKGPIEALSAAEDALAYYSLRVPTLNVDIDIVGSSLAICEFTFFGSIAWCVGDINKSRRLFLTAGSLLERLSHAPILRVLWLSTWALRMWDDDAPREAVKANLDEAMRIAHWQGYTPWIGYAAASRAHIAMHEHDLSSMWTFQRAALAHVKLSDSHVIAVTAMIPAVSIEERYGNPVHTRTLAHMLALRARAYPSLYARALLILGHAELDCCNLEATRIAVDELLGLKTVLARDPRLLGAGLRLQAECALAGNNWNVASRKINESIEIFRSGCPTYELRRSERLRKRILEIRGD